ncbi:Ultraviolet-B receptor UVR8 Protein UV-B RESISTANCE 8 RCC1 domain-containing protein [Vigna angularis]|uniref:Ultraviolet-B receptor UVR8 Protein UV-B RESISTANCE 8 RCC1 domain-containing protein n=2 Tax=Phaseolus angularis TaxID=3914 RepID=A0A8T0KJH9_PHAAN|nr:Ultraviolet-B receptor UVR8 Protein UV-B RESISTANCE 8 RCC1 domain-containing protein [Vigna angularis]
MEDAGKPLKSGNPSRKVVDLAAGEAHNLVLTGDGSVYSWGRGMFGRIGSGSETDELFPVQLKFGNANPNGTQDTVKVVGIAAGAYHSLALAEDGAVWSWGYNFYGQLGTNGEKSHDNEYEVGDHCLVPRLLNRFVELHSVNSSSGVSETEAKTLLKICAIKAGGMISLAIDNCGTLWVWGNCPQQSKEGELALVSSFTPTPVRDFLGRSVVKVACGNEHIVALVSAGESYNGEDLVCYSWGYNTRGQLGLGDRENRLHPEVVKTFDEESPYEVACGAYHTALLTRIKKSSSDTLDSRCWTFGLGDNGQLGHGTTQSTLFPTPVKELPQNVSLICVDCGLFHTSVVSSDGDVWSWGMEKGLGLCPDASRAGTDSGDALSPRLMSWKPNQPKFPDPVKLACGAAHTVIIAQGGYRMWSWGRGRSGVLGDGKGVDCYTPTLVLWPQMMDDSEEEEVKSDGEQGKAREKETEATNEAEEKLSSALNELKLLKTKLSVIKNYASILHGSVFGKPFDEQDIPDSLQNSGSFDMGKEWEKMLETADHRKLIRLEMFYRDMLAGVKDELMKRRIKEIVKECLQSSEV